MDLLFHKYFIQKFVDISYQHNFLLNEGRNSIILSEKNPLKYSVVFTEIV